MRTVDAGEGGERGEGRDGQVGEERGEGKGREKERN